MNRHDSAPTRLAATIVPTVLTLALALGGTTLGRAQGTKADYERAASLRERTRDKVVGAEVRPHWFAGNDRFWYRADRGDGKREFIVVDAVEGKRRPAFDHARLARALAKVTGDKVEADRLPIDRIEIRAQGEIRLEANGKGWRYDPEADKLTEGPKPEEPKGSESEPESDRRRPRSDRLQSFSSPREERSPDGAWTALIRDHDVYLRGKDSKDEVPLSFEGTESDGYEPRVFWSPDSKKLVALRTEKGDDRRVHLIESSPKDQLQPRLDSYEYLKPGDRVPITKPHLLDVAARKEIPVSDALFANPWSIERVRWADDSSRFTFLFNQRGHQVLRLIAVDAGSGEATALIDEKSSTFIDYAHKTFLRFLDKPHDVLWMSEREGWNHLYRHDARTGRLKNPVTQGDWVVREVEWVDEEKGQVWFRAGGIDPKQDPYYLHACRANLDGSGFVDLTPGDGTHRAAYSPDRRFVIDTYSRVDLPPVVELRRCEDGKLVCELERADWSALLATGWRAPERFVAKGRDGKTDIYGVIYRPTNFDGAKKYPVIEAIYAGPQGAFVPKAFAPYQRNQSLAELGFVVVQIDGMGTNWRSKAFHDVCWKNLGDAGFPDRIAWMKAAAAKDPALDLSRVGVFGGSAGGQNALGALLTHGDFYKVGAADCGCHDNRMDKVWWNELWMGWPIGPHYAEQSNVTQAHRLKGKLLLTVGELDHNVDPASTMQVVNALIKAGKDFELIVFPGGGHGAGSGPYGERRRNDFFVRHLLGVEPPDRNREDDAKSEEAKPRQVAVTHTVAKPAADAPKPKDEKTPALDLRDLDPTPGLMPGLIERFDADHSTLRRSVAVPSSPDGRARMKRFLEDWTETLAKLDFDAMGRDDRIDELLLKNHIGHELRQMKLRARHDDETAGLLPFAATILDLEETRRRMEDLDPARAAGTLDDLRKQVETKRKSVEADLKAKKEKKDSDKDESAKGPSKVVAYRAAERLGRLRGILRRWDAYYHGYDPSFTWWAAEPYKGLEKELNAYEKVLREQVVGLKPDDRETIVGDPIGREGLMSDLESEMIPYTPEELIAIANAEFAWCEKEMKRASNELGFGDDWHKALEYVKGKHVPPGKQPALIRDLAREAIDFLDAHDLVTIPPLARESWRMEMMTPERQLVNPFFTGGEVISVSYPTDTMTHEQKLMSMRGNNIHFARATVHHELIPGHHLQLFMADRHRPYRRLFSTPFLVEGWALYWEMVLWDMKFPKTAEDRVGMLFWRMHRCARIIFSLGFHTGKMTPRECIDFLVERVGHERENATAEVRRSFNGSYDPLYQCAYMLGALQLRALRRELVDAGKVTDRDFHDAVLKENAIPVEMIRASLTRQTLDRDFKTRWRFYGPIPEKAKDD